jgi:hypothetical protein
MMQQGKLGFFGAASVVLAMLLSVGAAAQDTDVGVEWINEYPICGFGGLSGRDDVAVGFYDEMRANGYTGRFNFGNSLAWANDFMDDDVVASGNDHSWVDTVDFAYHADHGNVGMFGFGVDNDRCIVSANQCRWGDNSDLEWIVLDDCSVLRHGQYGIWWQAFQKLHMIISFDTNAHDDSDRGRIFAEKLADGWSIRQAWWYACDQTEGSSTFAAIAGASNGDTSIYNEGVWNLGPVSADPVPLAWWWWTNHGC